MSDRNYPPPGSQGPAQPYPPQGYGYPPGLYGPPNQGYSYHAHFAPSSGHRVAAGVLGIVLGLFEFIGVASNASLAGLFPGLGFVAFLCLMAAIGCITNGIILLAKHRGRKNSVPILLLVFCSLAILTSFLPIAVASVDVLTLLITLGLGVPAIILLSKTLNRERVTPGFR